MTAEQMPEAFREVLAAHGAADFPWKRGHNENPVFECTVRGARLCIVDTWHKEGWKISVVPAGQYYNAFKHPHIVPYETVDEVLREKFAAYAAPDPRMVELPDSLRFLVEQFLDIHKAWGTDFDVEFDGDDPPRTVATVSWQVHRKPHDYSALQFARFNLCETGLYGPYLPEQYDLKFVDRSGPKRETFIKSTLPLARSADFAEFVQRFRSQIDG